jgi:hypothetical protein
MARAYGPRFRALLQKRFGIQPAANTTLIGSSGLRRARETAQMVFPQAKDHIVHLPHVKEFGDIPENTPSRVQRCRPSFRAFLQHLHTLPATIVTVICVAHGSFLGKEVWPIVAPGRAHKKFGNLDTIVVRTGLTADGRLLEPRTTELTWHGSRPTGADRCSRKVERIVGRYTRKIAGSSRMRNQQRKQQRGGAATSMPLAWYQQGAQFQGTTADPTGVGLAGSSAAWARSALSAQGGGRRRRSRRLRRRRSHKGQQGGFQACQARVADQQGGFQTCHARVADQQGGFVPSVMGAGFADVGMQLLPAAAYMGYNQFQHYKQQRRTRRRH